ncbi:MAG: alpha-glucan family phosphorylase [Candidatus Woesearchaeota archaeon]
MTQEQDHNTQEHLTKAADPHQIAYFSMEIGFRPEIPTYSGGLGILAGDTLKSLADMGSDVVAVTMLSEKGYFYQKFDEKGYQYEEDYRWSPEKLLTKLDTTVTVTIEGRDVKIGAWKYELEGIGGDSVPIIFLDTHLEENDETDQKLTGHLYGGDVHYRLLQEVVLGIGGARMLEALGYTPRKYHLNEGHAAFLSFELARRLCDVNIRPHDCQALLRKSISFTTHTPVKAGHDSFPIADVKKALGEVYDENIAASAYEGENFSMTKLALATTSYTNAVARKHQSVTKQMFPHEEIDYITNGVHSTTWTGTHIASLFDKHIIDWRRNPLELRSALKIPEEELLEAHKKAKRELVDYINTTMNGGFDYDSFTIGFARRATAYKRAELLFKDVERLKEISRKEGKIQLVFAGKAHPRDEQGKQIIQHIKRLGESLEPALKFVFLENYNMHLGQLLTSGVDLWLNTPQRPFEASGTSGMKAAHNGVPSLSIPDGWWVEGCIEGVTGWAIGPEQRLEQDRQTVDDKDAEDLYTQLADKIVPLYYHDQKGYARVMRNAIAINASYFNTHRMAKQYLVRAYTVMRD